MITQRSSRALAAAVLAVLSFGCNATTAPDNRVGTERPSENEVVGATRPLPKRGDFILFHQGRDLFAIRPNGSGRINFTKHIEPRAGIGKWSPNGSRIAFGCEYIDAYGSEICLIESDGTVRRLTRIKGDDADPDWSPDGRWIVFRHSSPGHTCTHACGGPDGLHAVSAAGGEVKVVTQNSGLYPSWGKEGIAYIARTPKIVVVDYDSGERDTLLAVEDVPYVADPDWSHDGRRIAFVVPKGMQPYIAVARADGKRIRLLGIGTNPAWSPNGNEIVFHGADGISLMRADGSGSRSLVRGMFPDWGRQRNDRGR